MPSPDRISAWLASAVRVRTPLQFFALALCLLFGMLVSALLVEGRVAAAVAIGALAWFAVVTVLAFVHARGPADRDRPGGGSE